MEPFHPVLRMMQRQCPLKCKSLTRYDVINIKQTWWIKIWHDGRQLSGAFATHEKIKWRRLLSRNANETAMETKQLRTTGGTITCFQITVDRSHQFRAQRQLRMFLL